MECSTLFSLLHSRKIDTFTFSCGGREVAGLRKFNKRLLPIGESVSAVKI